MKLVHLVGFIIKKKALGKQSVMKHTSLYFNVLLTVHHSIDLSKYQLSAQLF